MHTSVLGSGYVGATLAVCLADLGHDVTAVDIDATVVERLKASDPPIAEPGLATALTYIVDRERGEITNRLLARDLDISPLAAEIVLQALRPVVHEHVDIEGVDEGTESVADANFRESTRTVNKRFGREDINDWEPHAVDEEEHE